MGVFPTSATAGVPLVQEGIVYKLPEGKTVRLYGRHYADFRRAWDSGGLSFRTMVDEPVQSDEFYVPASALEEHVAQPGISPMLTTLTGAQVEGLGADRPCCTELDWCGE